ncbi:MAG: helix-turn-helix transcriptional regulator, partial [Lachnospiraceae bacterium]|nr:helix-turn-helix transcriptional regulator [Lachnospiraceae bacterium]
MKRKMSSSKSSIVVIFVLNVDKLELTMREQIGDGVGISYIANAKGELIAFQNNDEGYDEAYYGHVLDAAKRNLNFDAKKSVSGVHYKGRDYIVAREVSQLSNYEFIMVSSGDSLSEQIAVWKKLWLALLVFVLLTAMVALTYVVSLIYRPVFQIESRVKDFYPKGEEQEKGIYNFIASSIDFLEVKSLFLQEQVQQYQRYMITKLLCNELQTVEENRFVYDMLHLDMHDSVLYVSVVSMNEPLPEEEFLEQVRSCKMETFYFVVKELEHDMCFAVIWSMSRTAARYMDQQLEVLYECCTGVEKITCSEKSYDVKRVSLAFIRAAILDEMTREQAGIYRFDDEMEKLLPVGECSYIQKQVEARCWRNAKLYVGMLLEICEEKELYWNKYVCMCLSYFLSDEKKYLDNSTEKMNIFLLLKNQEKHFYYECMKNVLDYFAGMDDGLAHTENSDTSVIEKMKAYLTVRYNDPNFTFQEMADKYSMTLPALSKYFHEEVGMALSEYVTELKMSR